MLKHAYADCFFCWGRYYLGMTTSLLAIALHLLCLSRGSPDQGILLQCGTRVDYNDHSNDPEINYLISDLQVSNSYPNATMLAHGTNRYNCHSYAFYNQKPSLRGYEITADSILPVLSVKYTEVSFSNAAPGDRVLYFHGSSQSNPYEFLEHSGIIAKKDSGTSLFSGNLEGIDKITVNSKWGDNGLYKHPGNHCPYVPSSPGSSGINYYGVRYYHIYYTHSHSYTYSQFDDSLHLRQCACGCYYEAHNLVPYNIPTGLGDSPDYIPGWRCSQCYYVTEVNLDNPPV